MCAATQECKPSFPLEQEPSAHILAQRYRSYATEPARSTSNNTAIYGGLAAVAAAAAGYYLLNKSPASTPSVAQSAQPFTATSPRPRDEESAVPGRDLRAPSIGVFTGGDQGWIDLKLESVEIVNHNTKRLRFALPNEDDISGLHVACMLCSSWCR